MNADVIDLPLRQSGSALVSGSFLELDSIARKKFNRSALWVRYDASPISLWMAAIAGR